MTTRTWVALLRGVNVVGRNKLPMKAWAAELQALGLSNVRTYIQSGNAVFRGPGGAAGPLAKRIAADIHKRHGFEPHVLLIPTETLVRAVKANPYPDAEAVGRTLSVFFLEQPPPRPDRKGLDAAALNGERWTLKQDLFYLHTPNGFGVSKIAARAEKLLGVPATARNWNTVTALRQMAEEPK